MTLILNLHQDDVADEDNMTRIELRVQETTENKPTKHVKHVNLKEKRS